VIKRLRAVFDTNVFVSAALSRNPTSPTRELLRRWLADEFVLVVSQALTAEVIEKLLQHQIGVEQITELIANLERLGEWAQVPAQDIPAVIAADPDDDLILACAVMGEADYLVTYDPHFDVLNGEYRGVKITKALPFLWAVRGDRPA
jgi:uncharacterized protein